MALVTMNRVTALEALQRVERVVEGDMKFLDFDTLPAIAAYIKEPCFVVMILSDRGAIMAQVGVPDDDTVYQDWYVQDKLRSLREFFWAHRAEFSADTNPQLVAVICGTVIPSLDSVQYIDFAMHYYCLPLQVHQLILASDAEYGRATVHATAQDGRVRVFLDDTEI